MNNENFHSVQKVPPLAHALHKWDEAARTLAYEYNGENIITIALPESEDAGFRHGSDGTMLSLAYTQQVYVMVEKPMWVTITFMLSEDAVCMRPNRAGREEAILGLSGNILTYGIGGLYDVTQDLMIDVHGCEWRWRQKAFAHRDGKRFADMEVYLDGKPLYINLRMMYYRNHLGYVYHEPWNWQPKKKPVAGWCSWEAFRRDIDQNKIDEVCGFMEKKLKDYGLEYIQVDDGFQEMPLPCNPYGDMAEGWLTCNPQAFPEGHKGIVDGISTHGFTPAIWTNANITSVAFADNHKDNLILCDGSPMKGEWIDYLYNCSDETLKSQVEPIFEGLRREGYKYVKIDAIRHLLFDGLHEAVRLGILTNDEARDKFRAYMETTKKGLGEDVYYLASWGVMNEVIGVADACRIAMDANPTWAGVRMQLFEMARWFHAQRILFLNDPDHVCVRTKTEWAKSVLSLISLSGGLYMLSDTLDAYNEEKLDVIRKTLPPLDTRTGEAGALSMEYPAYTWTKLHGFAVQSHETPVEMEDVSLEEAYSMAGNYPSMDDDHPFSTLWSFGLEKGGADWCVAGRFATVPLRECTIGLDKVNVDPEKSYYAFDFWKQEFLGIVTGSLFCRNLEVGCCQIIGIREVTGVPRFIASSRHVSMDAVSVLRESWDEKQAVLRLTLAGIRETKQRYYIAVPDAYVWKNGEAVNGSAEFCLRGNLLHVEVGFADQEVCLKLCFEKR